MEPTSASSSSTVGSWSNKPQKVAVLAGLAPPDADELAAGGQGGEAQLRQALGDLGGEPLLLCLDAPVVPLPQVNIEFAAINLDFSLLKALAPAVGCLAGEVVL